MRGYKVAPLALAFAVASALVCSLEEHLFSRLRAIVLQDRNFDLTNGFEDAHKAVKLEEYLQSFSREERLEAVAYEFVKSRWILTLYFPGLVLIFLNEVNCASQVFRATVLALFLGEVILFVGYGVFDVYLVWNLQLAINAALLCLVLKVMLPKQKSIRQTFTMQIATIMGCSVAYIVCATVIDASNLVLFTFVFPVIREVGRYFVVRSAWHLAVNANLAGEGNQKVNRKHVVYFYAYFQLIFALFFRVQLTNSISDPITFGMVSLWQSALEIFLRCSMMKRDTFARSLFSRLHLCAGLSRKTRGVVPQGKLKSKVTVVGDDVAFASRTFSSPATDDADDDALAQQQTNTRLARKIFYAQVVLIEMLSEYVAIFVTAFAVWLSSDRIFVWPWPYYYDNWESGQTSIRMDSLYLFILLQTGSEALVDVVCYFWERRYHMPFETALENLPRGFTVGFTLTVLYAWNVAAAMVFINVYPSQCTQTNSTNATICDVCAIPQEGVFHRACMLVQQNETWP